MNGSDTLDLGLTGYTPYSYNLTGELYSFY